MSKNKGSGATGCLMLLVVFVVIGSCNALGDDDEPALAPGGSTNQYAASGRTTTTAPKPPGEVIAVKKALDGDTIELTDGRVVDVLGIDSCDPGTYGGDEATRMAESTLTNQYNGVISMTQEPGIDKAPNGRLLRYIKIDSGQYDFGVDMVEYDHTGVLANNNGASKAYMDTLYAHDLELADKPPAGRFCGNPYPPSSGGGGGDIDVDIDHHDTNLPDGALTGGYCARKWWC
jgi:endonuclease YncB( thermonuclease family)